MMSFARCKMILDASVCLIPSGYVTVSSHLPVSPGRGVPLPPASFGAASVFSIFAEIQASLAEQFVVVARALAIVSTFAGTMGFTSLSRSSVNQVSLLPMANPTAEVHTASSNLPLASSG